MTRRRNTQRYTLRNKLRRRGGKPKTARTRRRAKGTTIKGKMPPAVKDGLQGRRITGVLRKDSEHWQPLKKTTDEGERNQNGEIQIYEWSSSEGIRSIFYSRVTPFPKLIRDTLLKANNLQEQGYYIVDIHSDTSRPLYDSKQDNVPSASTTFTILYRAYKPSELTAERKNRVPINVIYWRRDSVSGHELNKRQAQFLSKNESVKHLSTTSDSYTPNADKLLFNTFLSGVSARMDVRHQAEWFYA